ncbi:MAG TPA: hypothetical protein DCE56_17650 [Cyanobacteria bacterium UBA8553]|nr:hypothetical protein [Cyanobacteria bacterium UBA8553]HAJ60755.1 hypothetical protein [Cyanobacteria bacterium UBA8543]
MKVFGLVLSALILLTTPAVAVEYQGKNLDGKKLTGQAYFSETGGVYDVQVLFKRNRATIYFVNGSQTTIKLRQQVITDPSDIQGVGGLGRFDLGGLLSIGLDSGEHPIGKPLQGFWRISLDLTDFNNPAQN